MNYTDYTNNRTISAYEFANMARELTIDGNKFKLAIIKSRIKHEDVDDKTVKEFINTTTWYIRFWSDYAKNIDTAIANGKPVTPTTGIPYNRISKYVIDNNDYTGILKYADDIMSDPKITTEEQVQQEYEDSVLSAFDDIGASTSEVVNNIAGDGDINALLSYTKLSPNEVKYFDNFRSNRNIYDHDDRVALYKALDLVLNYIKKSNNENIQPTDLRVYVAKLHSIIDYAIMSLVVYASRLYIIGKYVSSFINIAAYVNKVDEYDESVQGLDDMCIDTMKHTDEIMVRDMNKIHDYEEVLNKWKNELNVEDDCKAIDEALTGNVLFDFIRQYCYIGDADIEQANVAWNTRVKVREYLLNPDQAISTAVSPRQDFITAIKEVQPKHETIEGFKKLGVALVNKSVQFLKHIKNNANWFINWRNRTMSHDAHYPTNPSSYVAAAECARLLAEFYRDLAVAVLYKAREIEQKINSLNEAQAKQIGVELKIDVPGMNPDGIRSTNIDTIVPDTTRDSDNLIESIAFDIEVENQLAVLESYDEYAKLYFGMENDPYFTEAVDINSVVNNLIAKIISWGTRFGRFIGNASVQRAFDWVEKHQNNLKNMELASDAQMTIKKYKSSLQNVGGTEKIITALNGATIDTFKTTENKNKFIRSLYPSDLVANWFMSDNDQVKKDAKAMYRKLTLFYEPATITNVKAGDDDPVEECNSATIKNYLVRSWLPVILGYNDVLKAQKDDTKRIQDAVNSLKRKLVNNTGSTTTTTNTAANTNSNAAPTITTPEDKDNKSTTQNQNNQQQQQQQEKENINLQGAIAEIAVAIENIYGSTIDFMIEYYRNIYQYIQTANSMAAKQ